MVTSRSIRRFVFVLLALALVTTTLAPMALAKGNGKGRGGHNVVETGATTTVTIKVVGYYGSVPLADSRLVLVSDATGYRVAAKTGSDGCATFTDVPYPAEYLVDFSHAGYRSGFYRVTVDGNTPEVVLTAYPNSAF